MAGVKESEVWRWQSVSEESLLLHGDLLRLADHIALPAGVAALSGEEDYGLPVLDGKLPKEMAAIITQECGSASNTFTALMEYRLNALRTLWAAVRPAVDKQPGKKKDDSLATSSSKNSQRQDIAFASRISLVLVFPILHSLSKLDPELSSSAAKVLLESLRSCEPLSLSKEPTDCISGLENLLCSWLQEVGGDEGRGNPTHKEQMQTAASALVALGVAVGTGGLLLRTVHILQLLQTTHPEIRLLVPKVLMKLMQEHTVMEEPPTVVADAHQLCWCYDSHLTIEDKEDSGRRSMALDGPFLYLTSSTARQLLKVGNGLDGSIRGMVYATREVEPSWIVRCQGLLLMRRKSADNVSEQPCCSILDCSSLKELKGVVWGVAPTEPHSTVLLASDSIFLYWVYVMKTAEQVVNLVVPGDKSKQHAVYLQVLTLQDSEGVWSVEGRGKPLLLTRTLQEDRPNSDVVKALMRAGPSYALTTLLGGTAKDDTLTSCGLGLKQLQLCAGYCTGSSLVLIAPPMQVSSSRSLFGGGASSTSQGRALCCGLAFSLVSGQLVAQNELSPSPQLQCALSKGVPFSALAACYDPDNHCVWTCGDEWIDVWSCMGRVRPAVHLLAKRLGKGHNEDLVPAFLQHKDCQDIPVGDTIEILLRHSSMESCRLTPGRQFSSPVCHTMSTSFLQQCCNILDTSACHCQWDNVLSIIITLQAVLPGYLDPVSSGRYDLAYLGSLKKRVRVGLWQVMSGEQAPAVVTREVQKLISCVCLQLWLSEETEGEEFVAALAMAMPTPRISSLRNAVFVETARDLQACHFLPAPLLKMCPLIAECILQDSLSLVREASDNRWESLQTILARQPVFSPALRCAAAMLNTSLSALVQPPEQPLDEEGREKVRVKMQEARSQVMCLCSELKLFSTCLKILDQLQAVASSLFLVSMAEEREVTSDGDGEEGHSPSQEMRIEALERCVKGTALGCLLLPMLVVMSDRNVRTLDSTQELLQEVSQLSHLTAQVCGTLYSTMSSIRVPSPWASGRQVETIHPVRDNYKFKETVSFPGARQLFVKFDPRSSSQYDYDKVTVYAGDSANCTRVAEYGGNTHGFGSRSVLGKGWPKDLVKVEGDTATFTFEMKSGREHSTPDRAMWGFSCIVRPQEAADSSTTGLPFIVDLYLSLSSLSCSLIGQLFDGATPTAEEKESEKLMESNLLQRCMWGDEEDLSIPEESVVTKEALLPTVIQRLRERVGQPRPTLRPSVKSMLQVDALEQVILSVCLKHHGVGDILIQLGKGEQCPHDPLLEAVFVYINRLERRLQALVELESNWSHDIAAVADESMQVTDAFFFGLHHNEAASKTFELLCYLKEVPPNSDSFAAVQFLCELFEKDVQRTKTLVDVPMRTSTLVLGVLERAELLLQVKIAPLTPASTPHVVVRSQSFPFNHYTSGREMRRMHSTGSSSVVHSPLLLDTPTSHSNPTLLDEIFQFIGSRPEEAVPCHKFLLAAKQQRERSLHRIRALGYLQDLLVGQQLGWAVEHVLVCVGSVLQHGPRVKEVACSGMIRSVRKAFLDVMHTVVDLASRQPAACINTIALLCVVPYTREEEACLVQSGLVKLLDKLCSLSHLPDLPLAPEQQEEERKELLHRVTTLAWAAFQVLADRCVSWEDHSSQFISTGLAQQVSTLLTNHLAQAMESLVISDTGGSETLQEALSMLLGLACTHMGRTILSQPGCISKLLLLLTDQRPSPKLVLIALQLCRVALPLMTTADCARVVIPAHPSLLHTQPSGNLAKSIITLLLFKLSEYLVPSASHIEAKMNSDQASSAADDTSLSSASSGQEEIEEGRQMSVFLYPRESENPAEILQLLLSQDPRQFGQRIENVFCYMCNDRVAEIFSDSYRICVRRAIRWASMGFTVSIEPPIGSSSAPSGTESDRKKSKAESACKKRNIELLKSDPPRPFLSGTVAYSLASEIIALLNGLLSDQEAMQVWREAIKEVLRNSLANVPTLLPVLERSCSAVHQAVTSGRTFTLPSDLLSFSSLANATFATLGGFTDQVLPGMEVLVTGDGFDNCRGTVISISERRGVANVQFKDDQYCFGPNKTLEVSLTRLQPPAVVSLPIQQLDLQQPLCAAIGTVLSTSAPSLSVLTTNMDPTLPALGLCRLFSELRTRAMVVLYQHSQKKSFRETFLKTCSVESLLQLAKQTSDGDRLTMVENHCVSLRMLYRDCARPPLPVVPHIRTPPQHYQLDISRQWPPVHSCMFTQQLMIVTYQGPTSSTGATNPGASASEEGLDKPKGVFLLTSAPIPALAPSFYWELEVCQLDSSSSAPHLTMGLCPQPQRPADGQHWGYQEETCLLRSTGRGLQVRGEDRMQWNKFSFDRPLKTGDVVGCGYIREEGVDAGSSVYFTLNGLKQPHQLKNAPVSLFPFIHIQKKNTKVRVNFGDTSFSYLLGHVHRDAADSIDQHSTEELLANFEALPFASGSDSEDEVDKSCDAGLVIENPVTHILHPPTPSNGASGYSSTGFLLYHLTASYDNMIESGPLVRPGGGPGREEEEEEGEENSSQVEEDLHSLLVKAWETKVFPVIQRRFRNDQERRSGLEQIRGALQLGMDSIAQETVEFLYEENGGVPRDLHFPTLDDVKADLERFSIDRLRKGQAVVVKRDLPCSRCGVRAMQKTQGLTGVVLVVDRSSELVQVECYLPSDGALVRFWYPIVYLEKPPKGFRKPSALRGVESVNIMVHRELLQSEAKLASMYAGRSCLSLLSLFPLALRIELLASANFSQQPPGHTHCLSPEASLSAVYSHAHTEFFISHHSMEHEISSWLSSTEQPLLPVVEEICSGSTLSPDKFAYEQFAVTESRVSMEIESLGSAFLLVSCAQEKPGSASGAQYKFPWAKICWHVGGQAKNGRMPLQEVARFPSELSQLGGTHQYCGPTYPSLLLGTNFLHLRLGGCTPKPGQVVLVVGIPAALATSLALLHSLITLSCDQETTPPQRTRLCRALSACISPLINILCGVECPPMLREKLFLSICNALHVLTATVSTDSEDGSFLPAIIPSKFFMAIESELKKVYHKESSSFAGGVDSGVKGPPQSGSVFQGGCGKFSTYFQTLLALFLSMDLYQSKYGLIPAITRNTLSDSGSKMASNPSQESVQSTRISVLSELSSSQLLESTPLSVSSMSQESTADSLQMAELWQPRSVGSASQSESSKSPESMERYCDSSLPQTSDEGQASSTESRADNKDEWLLFAKRASQLLRFLMAPDSSGIVKNTLAQCLCSSLPVTPYDRLLVLTKFCPSTDPDQVEKDVLKICRQHGGLHSLHVASQQRKTQPSNNQVTSDAERSFNEENVENALSPREVVGVVLELCSAEKRSAVSSSLLSWDALQGRTRTLSVSQVSPTLGCKDDEDANQLLRRYLMGLLVSEGMQLTDDARQTLSTIFALVPIRPVTKRDVPSALQLFLNSLGEDAALSLWEKASNEVLSQETFLTWVELQCQTDTLGVWSGLFAVGYDLQFHQCGFLPDMAKKWSPDLTCDPALVLLVDSICRKLSVPSVYLHAHDINITEAELATSSLQPLQGLHLADLRLRFLLLQEINRQLCWLLPMVDLRVTYPLSLGSLLRQASPLLFYDCKVSFLHAVLNASTHRTPDQAPPEIKMDPLESVGGIPPTSLATHFCQAARQFLSIPSPQLCVPLASGGDPTYAFNVRLAGEEVHGTSGSFRHFLWQAVRELQSPLLPVIMVCPSSAAGVNKNRYILVPGTMSYSQERLLHFFGQLLGVAIRADVPVALDLLPCFWKSLMEEPLTLEDIKDADWLTYSHTQRLLEARDAQSFAELATSLSVTMVARSASGERDTEESCQRTLVFTYNSLSASVVELCEDGLSRPVQFADRHEYVERIRSLRLKELACKERMAAVRSGLASIIPLQLLSVFTTSDLDLRVCGIPDIDLDYLRRHTTYHVGLVESDQHIQFFWAAMESFSQEELRRFIKFACNQDRIPFGHPCRNENDTPTHVPPYPMKIAPPDGQDPPDSRYIRAETCMFLVKLPQYSTQELMTERLRYAINCREDPLSG